MSQEPIDIETTLKQAEAAENERRYADAVAVYEKLVSRFPSQPELLCLQGNALFRAGDPDLGTAALRKAVALKPDFALAWHCLGAIQRSQGRLEEALASFARAAKTPGQLDSLCGFADVLFLLNRRDAAVQAYKVALSLAPRYLPALVNLGAVLYRMRRYEESADLCRKALEVSPDSANALSNLGNALAETDRPLEALAYHEKALAVEPEHPELLLNLGNAYLKLNRVGDAIDCFRRAQRGAPEFIEAILLEGTSWLRLGNGREGWWRYEYRLKENLFSGDRKPRLAPGAELRGRTVLLEFEEGHGDAFQFLRFVPWLEERGARVELELAESMRSLVARTFPGLRLLPERGGSEDHDLRSNLMSLPYALEVDVGALPDFGRYLQPDTARLSRWKERLAEYRGPKVGIVWAGHPKNIMDRRRSMPLSMLRGLFDGFGGTVFRLQRDCPERDKATLAEWTGLVDVLPGGGDFDELASVLANLDLVVSVDTSVAHLSGALAQKTWVLLAHSPDWRWMEDRTDTPWYPSMRLFRQPAPGDWDSVVAAARAELLRL